MTAKKPKFKRTTLQSVCILLILYAVITAATLIKHFFVLGRIHGSTAALNAVCLALSLLLLVFVYGLYCFAARQQQLVRNPKTLAAISATIALTYIASLYLELINVYLMPVFLTAFVLTSLVKRKDTFIANIFTIMLLWFALSVEYIGSAKSILSVAVMMSVGIFCGGITAFCLSYEYKKLNFILKGISVGAVATLLISALSLLVSPISVINGNLSEFFNCLMWASISSFSQLILALLLQPVIEKIFNLLTDSRLIELTDHNSPLIKRLLSEAPGTFNHSLNVANFAEICAVAIGENPYFMRAAAYYHDIGKLVKPQFYKENQSDGNPHDEILPEVSADIIRSHTTEGYKLCREYHIPEEIAQLTIQHHGTLPIMWFYKKAQSLTDSDVDIYAYSYHGKTPTSKVAALLMICDSGEAAIRAMDRPDGDKVEKLMSSLISARIEAGQFDNCDITLKELNMIKETIVDAFGGVYHRRIKY